MNEFVCWCMGSQQAPVAGSLMAGNVIEGLRELGALGPPGSGGVSRRARFATY